MKQKQVKEEDKMRVLYKMSGVLTSTLEPKALLQVLLKEAIQITGADSGSIMLIEPDREIMKVEVAIHISDRKIRSLGLRIGEGVTGWVAKNGKPLLVPDVKKDKRYVQVDPGIRCELAVPLVIKGAIIGVINLDSQRVGAFTQKDLELFAALATHSSKIIQNARLYSEVKNKAEKLSTLFNIGQVMISKVHLQDLLNKITEEAVKLTETKICSLMLVGNNGKELEIRSLFGGSERYLNKPNLPIRKSLIGRVVLRKKTVFVLDVKKMSAYRYPEIAEKEGLCSLLAVPLIFQDVVIGVLTVYTASPRHFSKEETDVLSALASLSAMAIENARIYSNMAAAEEMLRQRDRLTVLGELAAEIAHEIRNPLTVIKMLVASQGDAAFDEEQRKDNQLIQENIVHIERLVEQVLSIGKPGEISLEPAQLCLCLDQTLKLMRFRIDQQNVNIKLKLQEDIPEIMLDSGLMSQVFMNLIQNALQAMPDGGTLAIRVLRKGEHIHVIFSDTGHGISDANMEKVFKPFFTSKKGGMGLGLSVVQRIVEGHGGKIYVKSTLGKGTTFSIVLPLRIGS
ncbi:MAG: GAF domain-containing protein [Chlamydiota bacterium]|nr:GAF domain-containing protein [Chlamydiota bacterium]